MAASESDSLLEKLDTSKLKQFDAFPKLPSSYKTRSESRGILTLLVALAAFVLLLNDVSEWVWGWPDYEFGVSKDNAAYMDVNVDMIVNMPCQYLSIDLRDAAGDRLHLSSGFVRDGTLFDIGQATTLKAHTEMLDARKAVSQSRQSRGLFSFLSSKPSFRPTYQHRPDAGACRIYGSLTVKRVTANLHVTTMGHGYSSYEHVDHSKMNLSHVITELSFGPFFPEMTQPLDNSFEIAHEPFIAYQYFLHIVPTTYIAPRSYPLYTHQYSVTHYNRVMSHGSGTPGIFFKFDIDPMHLTIHQRTTSFLRLVIRCIGVIGGIFTCTGFAIKVGSKALETVTGPDTTTGIVAAEASGVQKSKWRGGTLVSRSGSSGSRVVRQGNGWVIEGSDSPYGGSLAGTPAASPFVGSPYAGSPYSGAPAGSPFPTSAFPASPAAFGPPPRSNAGTPLTGSGHGLGFPSPAPPQRSGSGSSYLLPGSGSGTPASMPGTPAAGYSVFPPTPAPNAGFGTQQPPTPIFGPGGFNNARPPPPPRANGSNGSLGSAKKDD